MNNIVIATTTRYKGINETRAQSALTTIQKAKKYGHKIVVVDDSPETVKKVFQKNGAIVFPETKAGMGPGRRQTISKSLSMVDKKDFIAWIEPEKYNFIKFLNEIVIYMVKKSIDLLLPGRKSLESYPVYQQHFETLGRIAFLMLTGKDLDAWFGPRIFVADNAHFFIDYDGEYGDLWDSIFIPVLRAIKAGRNVDGYDVDYLHPQKQTREEKTNFLFFKKRAKQLNSLIKAMEKESIKLGLY